MAPGVAQGERDYLRAEEAQRDTPTLREREGHRAEALEHAKTRGCGSTASWHTGPGPEGEAQSRKLLGFPPLVCFLLLLLHDPPSPSATRQQPKAATPVLGFNRVFCFLIRSWGAVAVAAAARGWLCRIPLFGPTV